MLRKLLLAIKRPGLLWLSKNDVAEVRNRIIALYLAPGQFVPVAPPRGSFGINFVELHGGVSPCFRYSITHESGATDTFVFWLKMPKGLTPYWDHVLIRDIEPDDKTRTVEQLCFSDPRASVPATLIYHWKRHFPFIPTQNYLQNGGEFVA